MSDHVMHQTAFYDDGTHRLECDDCDAVYLLRAGRLDRLIQPDPFITHSWASPGLSFTAEVAQ